MVNLDRRRFVRDGAVAVAATSACLCGLGGCAAYTGVGATPAAAPGSFTLRDGVLTVELSKAPGLDTIGSAVKILHPAIPDGLIVARVDENRYEVVALACTHRGVELEYDHQRGRFRCASIGRSAFSMDGENISGPANRPLRAYDAVLADGRLTIAV